MDRFKYEHKYQHENGLAFRDGVVCICSMFVFSIVSRFAQLAVIFSRFLLDFVDFVVYMCILLLSLIHI